MQKYLSTAQVLQNLGVSKQTLWRWVRVGKFPAPVKLSERRIAWRERDVRAWEASRAPVPYAPTSREG